MAIFAINLVPALPTEAQWRCEDILKSTTLSESSFNKSYLYPALHFLVSESHLDRHQSADRIILDQFEFGLRKYEGPFHGIESRQDHPALHRLSVENYNNTVDTTLPFALKKGTRFDRAQDVDPSEIVETYVGLDSNEGIGSSRLVFYNGDVFSANSYRTFAFGKGLRLHGLRDFVRTRAWLERTQDTQGRITYDLHREHAGRRILKTLFEKTPGDKIDLYRGTYQGEVLLMDLAQKLIQQQRPSIESIHQLLKSIQTKNAKMNDLVSTLQILEQQKDLSPQRLVKIGHSLISQYENAISEMFFSVSESTATQFSKGSLLKVSLNKTTLLKLYESGYLYVGIEGSIEMNFFAAGINSLFLEKIVSKQIEPENLGFMESDDYTPLFRY